ncbi:D-alanyl-D-alanine dipeptidase [Candidatus Saccharibacteria bacterium CG_4_10_14_0_2_um_filter_52_9]|nr:MAG: D-alanyl-D-alanine dipeptidase [Candidatus Saccharibacteria bacterium CG_4_10_14_0_2_um_filter_52_9]
MKQLRELTPLLPEGTIVDLKYATSDNFTGEVLYTGEDTVAKLLEPAAYALAYAAQLMIKPGLFLVVWDAHRPVEAHNKLVAFHKGPDNYVLDPDKSMHPKGLAVDVTLADKNGNLLDMATGFDRFGSEAHDGAEGLSWQQQMNRKLLKEFMKEAGFVVWPYEWWHFNFVGFPPNR